MNMQASLFSRDCGILLHPTSLPNAYGVGDFGPAAVAWVEQLAGAGQSLWQILPLNPAGYGDSPYQGLAAFAANPILLSPERCFEAGLLRSEELKSLQLECGPEVRFSEVYANKLELAARVAAHFFGSHRSGTEFRSAFESFEADAADWLEDFALYSALKARFGGVAWTDWPTAYRDREPEALKAAAAELETEIRRVKLEQFLLRRQWEQVRRRARDFGLRIVGDLPIFVAHDSADVWCRRDLFRLEADGKPSVVAGVPPDYFSSTGQLWGNPLYAWDAHRAERFRWWRKRLKATLSWVDIVRIDHFRGFESCWEVPGYAETAADGTWVPAPGAEIFDYFVQDLGWPLPVIAEDLGVITPEVTALRDRFNLPGIRIEQFAFGTDPMRGSFLPEAYDGNCVAYTGTHDNDTVVGWFNSSAGEGSTRSAAMIEAERDAARAYFGTDGSQIHYDFLSHLYLSDCGAAIAPLQDLMGLGSAARMNTPGQPSGSWRWRLEAFSQTAPGFEFLNKLTQAANRGRFTRPATAGSGSL